MKVAEIKRFLIRKMAHRAATDKEGVVKSGFCALCGLYKHDIGDDDLCNSCRLEQAEDHANIEKAMLEGHTYHCACRLVWGDGECECKLKGIVPGEISQMILERG